MARVARETYTLSRLQTRRRQEIQTPARPPNGERTFQNIALQPWFRNREKIKDVSEIRRIGMEDLGGVQNHLQKGSRRSES